MVGIFRRNAIAFRAIGMGNLMFVRSLERSTRNQFLEFLENRLTDIVYSRTGYDVIIYFRSAANRTNV